MQMIDSYYPRLRYPSGDTFTQAEAEKCYILAKEVFQAIYERLSELSKACNEE